MNNHKTSSGVRGALSQLKYAMLLTPLLAACTGTTDSSSSSIGVSSSAASSSHSSEITSTPSSAIAASSAGALPAYNTAFDRTAWVLTASHGVDNLALAIDADTSTRWATAQRQAPNQWLAVELPKARTFNRIVLNSEQSPNDYPQGFEVYVSNDGSNWGEPVLTGTGNQSTTILHFEAVEAKHFRIVQTGTSTRFWWAIHELNAMLSDEPAPEYVDCSDMQALMAQPELGCTASGCHSVTPSQAAKVSFMGSLNDLAVRFNDAPSVNSNCADEKVIDTANPSNSLLLKLISPHSASQCSTKMPIGSNGVSDAQYACFANWVEDIAAININIEEPENEPFIALDGFASLSKVKALLHGGAVTNNEMAAALMENGALNTTQLKSLINTWMQTSEFDEKFIDFLKLTLQQSTTDTSYRATLDVINNNLSLGNFLGDSMKANLEEGFSRTALRFVKEGQDFRQIATTTTWDVTTAVLVAMAYHDYQNRRPFLRDETNPGILRQYAHIEDGDFSDWRQVTFTQRADPAYFNLGDPATASNLRAIPDGGELALKAQRVGYFSTISFLENWISNVGNKFRVTTNQTMITGLGLTFEAGDITAHGNLAGLDEEHAGAAECYACHRLMDPMAQLFSNSFNLAGNRTRDNIGNTPASFAFFGANAELTSMYDLAQAIHDHPNFGKAWVGKICNWATSTECDQTSEEFNRLVTTFTASGYRFDRLIVELFASPLVTYSQHIDGIKPAPAVILNRTNHFCHNMKARLEQVRTANGIGESSNSDLCTLSSNIESKVSLLAKDEFSRGALFLTQAVTLDPFLTSGYQQLCEGTQNLIVSYDAGKEGSNFDKFFDANNAELAIEHITTYIFGYPSNHAQHDNIKTSLQRMYDIHTHPTRCADTGQDIVEANTDGVVCGLGERNKATALKQVWIAACAAPSVMSIGF